jgi:hypothetical protein
VHGHGLGGHLCRLSGAVHSTRNATSCATAAPPQLVAWGSIVFYLLRYVLVLIVAAVACYVVCYGWLACWGGGLAATRPSQRLSFANFLVGHFFFEVLVLVMIFAGLLAAACARELSGVLGHLDSSNGM